MSLESSKSNSRGDPQHTVESDPDTPAATQLLAVFLENPVWRAELAPLCEPTLRKLTDSPEDAGAADSVTARYVRRSAQRTLPLFAAV